MNSLFLRSAVFFGIGLTGLAQDATHNYTNIGTASGDGYRTSVHAFNPNLDETIFMTLRAVTDTGDPDGNVLQHSGAFTVTLAPLQSAKIDTNQGDGFHAGFLSIEADGAIVGWSSERAADKKQSLVLQNTSSFMELNDIGDHYLFPDSAAQGADPIELGGALEVNDFAAAGFFGVSNTEDFTATMIVSGYDALLGSDLGETTLEIPPRGGLLTEISDLFDTMPTGRAILRTTAVSGKSLPFISTETQESKAKQMGIPMDAPIKSRKDLVDRGNGAPQVTPLFPFQHMGSNDFSGYYTVTGRDPGIIPSGTAFQSDLDAETPESEFFANQNPGSTAYVSNELFAHPFENESGSIYFQLQDGDAVAAGVLTGEGARTYLQPLTALTNKAVLSLDGSLDWNNRLEDSGLLVENLNPEPQSLSIISLNEAGDIIHNQTMNINSGRLFIPASALVEGRTQTAVVMFEKTTPEADLALDFIMAGEGKSGHKVLDRIPIRPLGSAGGSVVQYLDVIDAWSDDADSCLGSILDVTDLVSFINNGYNCPVQNKVSQWQ